MWKKRRVTTTLKLTAFCLVLMSVEARADFITSLSTDVTPISGGLYQYTYNLTDTTQSTIAAFAFAVDVDQTANLGSIMTPAGWDVTYNTGDLVITWSTGFSPIEPGGSAAFSFESIESPVNALYQATGFDPVFFQFYGNSGTTVSPGVASVPEPTSVVLLASGLTLILTHVLATLHRRKLIMCSATSDAGRL
jgi:hypothetical protein